MIREEELLDAIAECQGTRNPNANTCIKLASFYTILDHIKKPDEPASREYMHAYSFDTPTVQSDYKSDSEFGRIVQEKNANDVLKTIDELMETLRMMQPRLYDAFMRKLTALD